MLSGFFDLIILMGALQGVIVSSLLFFSRKNQPANKLLAVFIFFIALACFNLYLANQRWPPRSIMPLLMAVVPMVIIMPAGPLLLFYIKAVLQPGFRLARRDRFHFATVIIDLFPYLTALFFIVVILSGVLKHAPFNVGLFIDTYNVYADIPHWASLTVYLVLSVRYIATFRKSAEAQCMPKQLKWLRQLSTTFIIFQSIWLLYLIPYVIPAYGDKLLDAVSWYPIYLPMAVLIYWLGIKGYLVMQDKSSTTKKAATTLAGTEPARVIAVLTEAMEQDALYLNPALTINLLAQHTAIPQKTISAVLNQYQRKSFNEFVNEYRIAAFKQRVCADDVKHLTIAGIAAECGFNSQATFQRTFRQFTGLSPSQFKVQAVK